MKERYQRQILLPEIGVEGLEKLRKARVLTVGVGGLGCPIALYLCGAGVGHLGLIDDDYVSISNLPRQVLYDETDIGKLKVSCAVRHLQAKNCDIQIDSYPFRLDKENAEALIAKYDIIVDGCDNHDTRYLISDVCHQQQKPYVYAAIGAFRGQAGVLCYDEQTSTYRTLFPDEEVMCKMKAEKGVIGTTPAVIGSLVANEVIKLIIGHGDVLKNKLFCIDLLTLQTQLIHL